MVVGKTHWKRSVKEEGDEDLERRMKKDFTE